MKVIKYIYPLAACYFSGTHYYLGDLLSKTIQGNTVVYSEMAKYVDINKLGYYSSWADRVKNGKDYRWSKQQHYIDIPGNMCNKMVDAQFVKSICKNNCIYTTFLNITNSLRYNRQFVKNITEEIYFLVHFLQDFHQPMHVYGDYRGGNDLAVQLKYLKKTIRINFHSLWDKYIPEHFIKTMTNLTSYETNTLNIRHFELYLFNHIKLLFNIACNVTDVIRREKSPSSLKISFNDYYEPFQVFNLFKNYQVFSMNVLHFIFN